MKDRYQAQAKQFLDHHGQWRAWLRVIDRERHVSVLPETTVQLPPEHTWKEFNPVVLLFERGWIIETPYAEWEGRDEINGSHFTHDVRPVPKPPPERKRRTD